MGERSIYRRGGALLAVVAAVLAVVCALAPVVARAADKTVGTFGELQQAVADATDETVITVGEDIAFEGTVTVAAGQNVTINGAAEDVTLSWQEGASGKSFFDVEAGGSLTLDVNIDAAALSVGSGSSYVGNFATVNGSLTLEGGTYQNATCRSYEAGCFLVDGEGATMTINDATITNNQFTNQMGGIITVQRGGELTMNGGTITDNVSDQGQINNSTVYVRGTEGNATFTMNGGEISNNTGFMGGVFVGERFQPDYTSTATFTMNDGTISGNKAGYCGGGVAIWTSGSFYMKGGTISNNLAPIGGGVAASDLYKSAVESTGNSGAISVEDWGEKYNCPARFEMTGGTITGNTAVYNYLEFLDSTDGGCGGGVYVASNTCSIFAGTISNNTAERQGGGVYVGSTPYVLHMKDVLVTDNTASILGGGMWLCPTGDAHTSVSNGALISGNSATSADGATAGDDIASVPQEGRTATITLADRALGGGAANWYDDGAVTSTSPDGVESVLGYADPDAPRYDGQGATSAHPGIVNEDGQLALKSVASDDAVELASSLAKVFITGNSSQRGGGIGTNGAVVIGPSRTPGEEVEQTWSLTVNKQWDGVPEEYRKPVSVRLTVGSYQLDTVELNAENGWSATFEGLPDPDTLGDLTIGVAEEGNDYEVTYGDVVRDDENRTLTVSITNAPKSAAPVDVKITAHKVLEGATLADGQFTFELVDESGTVVATATNDEEGVVAFDALTFDAAGDYAYQIREVAAGAEGVTYDSAVHDVVVHVTNDYQGHLVAEVEGNDPTFTNSFEEPDKPVEEPTEPTEPTEKPTEPTEKPSVPVENEVPQTSDPMSVAPSLAMAFTGVAAVAGGAAFRRKRG